MTSFNHVDLDEAHTPSRYLRVSIFFPGRFIVLYDMLYIMLRGSMSRFFCHSRTGQCFSAISVRSASHLLAMDNTYIPGTYHQETCRIF